MKTDREKKLEIALLKEKIERISGKKVLFKETLSIMPPKKESKSVDVENLRAAIIAERETNNLKENNVSLWKSPYEKEKTFTVVSYDTEAGKYNIDGDFEAMDDMGAITQARNLANPKHMHFEAFVANSEELEEFKSINNFIE
jgi:hypothetical protein